MLSMSTDDTRCRILLRLDSGLPVGHASAANVSHAAQEVIKTCVIQRRIGGGARNIGRICPIASHGMDSDLAFLVD